MHPINSFYSHTDHPFIYTQIFPLKKMLILPINKYNSFYSIDTKILLYLFVTLLGHRWSLRYLTRNDASGEIKWNEGSKNRQVSNFPVPVNHVEQDTFRASQISSHSRTPTTKTSWREHHRGIIIFAHKPPTWRPTSSLHSKLHGTVIRRVAIISLTYKANPRNWKK